MQTFVKIYAEVLDLQAAYLFYFGVGLSLARVYATWVTGLLVEHGSPLRKYSPSRLDSAERKSIRVEYENPIKTLTRR